MNNRIEHAYRQMHPRLWRALLAYCGDPDMAGDAASEAFAQALRRGEEVRDVQAWVWRSAFKVAAGMLKTDAPTVHLVGDHPAMPDPELAEFLSQLAELSDQQRAIVVLRYVGNFRQTEIADLLHTSPGTVRVQLHRAHALLKAQLERTDV